MNTVDQMIALAKENSKTSDWPYGESYYKSVICRYNPESNRCTFTIDYKKASKQQVVDYLK